MPSCKNGAHELNFIGCQCFHMGKYCMCLSFAGRIATILEKSSPSEMCLSDDESQYLCAAGKYLCESSAVYNFVKSAHKWKFLCYYHLSLRPCDTCQVQGVPGNCSTRGEKLVSYPSKSSQIGIDDLFIKGLSFISDRQRRKEGTFCASGLAGIEPTPPAPEERGMRAFRQLG